MTSKPVTWCRLLGVGPVCPHPCVDCKRADAALTDDQRARLMPETDLFGDPVPEPIDPVGGDPHNVNLKPKRRKRADIVADRIAVGRHPLTNGPLHPEATRDRTKDSEPAPFTCGSCVHRGIVGHHTRSYPKCLIPTPGVPLEPPPEALYDRERDTTPMAKQRQTRAWWAWWVARYPRVSRSDATDVRAWWPACPAYEEKGD